MFWRKEQDNGQIFSHDSHDQRASFRVCSLVEPIRIEFQGTSVLVEDISAGGLSFYSSEFQVGDCQSITFDLPGEDITISAEMQIIDIDRLGVCHCRFVGLSDDFINAIHRYALGIQIEGLRTQRKPLRKVSNHQKICGKDKALEDPVYPS